MSIYVCEKCGTIDNTALGGYWKNCANNQLHMCSECNTGKWHGEFPKQHWSELYTVDDILKMEAQGNGSMINASEYFHMIGVLDNLDKIKSIDVKDFEHCLAELDNIISRIRKYNPNACICANQDSIHLMSKLPEGDNLRYYEDYIVTTRTFDGMYTAE